MHAQLSSLLASSEATGGLSAAQAAAELAGVAPSASSSSGGGPAALAEARCRERFERKALEEFIRHALHDELPPAPAREHAERSDEACDNEAEPSLDEASLEEALGGGGGDGGLAELDARLGMLGNAYRSHERSWVEMASATADRVRTAPQLPRPPPEPEPEPKTRASAPTLW